MLPANVVGPVSSFQLFPRLSFREPMLTGRPFQEGWLETKATRVEAPMELKAVEVCAVSAVALMYPRLLTTTGAWPRTVMLTVAVLLSDVPSLTLKVNASLPT